MKVTRVNGDSVALRGLQAQYSLKHASWAIGAVERSSQPNDALLSAIDLR